MTARARQRLVEHHQLLGRPGHRDVAVDGALDAGPEALRVDEHDQVELEALDQLRGERADPRPGREAGIADHAGDPVGVGGEPPVDDGVQVGHGTVHHGDVTATDRGRHVGVRQHGADHRLGLGHHLLRRPVVDGEARQRHALQTDPLEPLLPRLGEAVPRLRAVAHHREAPGRAALQQHLPLGVGELLRLVDHHVRERAGQQVGVGDLHGGVVDDHALRVVEPEHRHHQHLGVVARDEVVDHVGHLGALGGERRGPAPLAARRLRVAQAQARGIEHRQVGRRPRPGVLALEPADVGRVEPGGAPAQVRGHRPQVGHDVLGVEHGPGAAEDGVELLALPQPRAQEVGRRFTVVLVEQDLQQLVPDLLAGLVVRGARVGRVEGRGPVGGGQPHVAPRRRDGGPGGGWLLVERDRPLHRAHQVGRRLQPRHLRVGLRPGRGTLGEEVPQGAGLHAVLAEAREHVGDVAQVRAVRSDEQDAAAPVAQPRVGVEEVRGAVQGDDGLPGAGPAVDDERACGPGTDDRVLVGLDRAEDVAHPRGAVGAEAGDEGGLVVEGGVALEPVRGEDLVPVVGDPATGPAVAASADQTHRSGVRRAEERCGGGGAPVDQEASAVVAGQAQPSDVHRVVPVVGDHPAEAHVGAEPAEQPQPRGEAVDLLVAVEGSLTRTGGPGALGVEAGGQLGDGLLEAAGDGGEVQLVAGDEGRVGLGGEVVWQVERTRGAGGHGIGSDLGTASGPASAAVRPAILRPHRGLAASPLVRYTLRTEGDSTSDSRPGRFRRSQRNRARPARQIRPATTALNRSGPKVS